MAKEESMETVERAADGGVAQADASVQTADSAGAISDSAVYNPEIPLARRILSGLSFRRASALYVFAALFLLFALWVPDTFLTKATWTSLLDSQALIALAAVGLMIPLSAGVFDFAIGAEVGFGAIFVAYLLTSGHMDIVPAIGLTLVAGVIIGIINGLLVTKLNIDSFIATLATSSILYAMIAWVSNSQQILGLSTSFQGLGQSTSVFGVENPVWIMLVVALVVWYVLERTPVGRRIYATGGNPDSARLSGVKTMKLVRISFIVSASVGVATGILLSSQLATGDPTVGPGYLLPTFSAAFLGSTQFRGGRFNVWGTVIAVYVLATGVKGLQLAGAPLWIPDLFNGVALIIAVGLAKYQRTARRASAVSRMIAFTKNRGSEASAS
jgi:ribose transport system permease protein